MNFFLWKSKKIIQVFFLQRQFINLTKVGVAKHFTKYVLTTKYKLSNRIIDTHFSKTFKQATRQ